MATRNVRATVKIADITFRITTSEFSEGGIVRAPEANLDGSVDNGESVSVATVTMTVSHVKDVDKIALRAISDEVMIITYINGASFKMDNVGCQEPGPTNNEGTFEVTFFGTPAVQIA